MQRGALNTMVGRPIMVLTILSVATVGAIGCATIGPAVPQLSARVGTRMAEMRALHQHAVRRMFAGERERVEDFIDRRWAPTFLRNFLGMSGIVGTVSSSSTIGEEQKGQIAEALKLYLSDPGEASQAAAAVAKALEGARRDEPQTVRRELDRFVPNAHLTEAVAHVVALVGTADPGQELIDWADAARRQIEDQRRTLLAPINEAEQQVLAELDREYDLLHSAQAVVTARVEAAAKLKQIQDSALNSIGLDPAFARTRERMLALGPAVGKGIDALEKMLEDRKPLDAKAAAATLRGLLGESKAAPNTTP